MPKSAIAPTSSVLTKQIAVLTKQNAVLRTMLRGAIEAIDNQKDIERGNVVLRAHGRFAVTLRQNLEKMTEVAPTNMRRIIRTKV